MRRTPVAVGVGNGLILGYLMYSSVRAPRRMAMFGLVGGPLVCASGIASCSAPLRTAEDAAAGFT